MQIKGIAKELTEKLVAKTNELSQGRAAGCLGFVDSEGYISSNTEIVDGGINGLPFRLLLDRLVDMEGLSLFEGIESLPPNTVVIGTNPGGTGLITDTGGINLFNLPMVNIGVKAEKMAGVGIVYPAPEYFDLATRSEEIKIELLTARDMDEEKEMLRASNKMSLRYLDMAEELPICDRKHEGNPPDPADTFELPAVEVEAIDGELARELVDRSREIEQGREIAAMGIVDEGCVIGDGKLVEGGIGYIPSRLLASSVADIKGRSLRQAYSEDIPSNACVVHTHPGGSGVMHTGDAMAGPGTWGRPIIAIGHDGEGNIQGATVITKDRKVFSLADEHEELSQKFFEATTPSEETELRKRRFGIAQEYTDLCRPVEIT